MVACAVDQAYIVVRYKGVQLVHIILQSVSTRTANLFVGLSLNSVPIVALKITSYFTCRKRI